MPGPHPPVRAQTIKQAKASYISRGRPTISEAEKKRLARAAELDRRAWRIREAELRKAEVARKRGEKEKKDREELAKAPLGSQCRIDKFGYKSSQMHLGAFLRRPPRPSKIGEQKENVPEDVDVSTEFDDLLGVDMDPETLIALELQSRPNAVPPKPGIRALAQSKPVERPSVISPPRKGDSWEDFIGELDSSTQIARELDAEPPSENIIIVSDNRPEEQSAEDEFDFDLSEEDLAELATTSSSPQRKAEADRALMPPPPPPPLVRSSTLLASNTVHVPEFTLSQLEQIADDDLQLTQFAPG